MGGDANLRSEAVEAMNVLIKNSAKDMTVVVRSTLEVVLSHLEQSFAAQILTAEDRDRVQGLQSLLCGNLQVGRDGGSMAHAYLEVGLLATGWYRRVATYSNLELDKAFVFYRRLVMMATVTKVMGVDVGRRASLSCARLVIHPDAADCPGACVSMAGDLHEAGQGGCAVLGSYYEHTGGGIQEQKSRGAGVYFRGQRRGGCMSEVRWWSFVKVRQRFIGGADLDEAFGDSPRPDWGSMASSLFLRGCKRPGDHDILPPQRSV